MKIEKRVTEKDLKNAMQKYGKDILTEEAWDILCQIQIQTLKDQQTKDTEYEIIQPKQLNAAGKR